MVVSFIFYFFPVAPGRLPISRYSLPKLHGGASLLPACSAPAQYRTFQCLCTAIRPTSIWTYLTRSTKYCILTVESCPFVAVKLKSI